MMHHASLLRCYSINIVCLREKERDETKQKPKHSPLTWETGFIFHFYLRLVAEVTEKRAKKKNRWIACGCSGATAQRDHPILYRVLLFGVCVFSPENVCSGEIQFDFMASVSVQRRILEWTWSSSAPVGRWFWFIIEFELLMGIY